MKLILVFLVNDKGCDVREVLFLLYQFVCLILKYSFELLYLFLQVNLLGFKSFEMFY